MNEKNKSPNKLSRITPMGWLGIVALFGILERMALWLAYPPVTFDDTNSYRRLAGQIMGSAAFDGTRSPGYPIFLAWLGPDRQVYAVQLALGLATTLLFFYAGWLVSGKGSVGAAAALIHTLNLGQLLFEADLLAETLTTFFVMVTICGGIYLLKRGQVSSGVGSKQFGVAFLSGVAGGLAALSRPQFVFLPFLIAGVLIIEPIQNALVTLPGSLAGRMRIGITNGRWVLVAAIIIPALFLNGLWINYIHTQFGVWSMSSDDGYHLIQHTGKFFEYAPEEDAAIRDTFLKYRAIQIANTGASSNTIWAAIPALEKVTGLGFYKLSHKLQEISLLLIREHPLLYLRSVLEAWAWFWSAPFYWSAQGFGAAQAFFNILVQIQRGLLWAANAIFIAGTATLLIPRVRKILGMPVSIWLVLVIVWVNSILQAIVEASENPRYSISTQTLVLLVVAWWLWKIIKGWRQHHETH